MRQIARDLEASIPSELNHYDLPAFTHDTKPLVVGKSGYYRISPPLGYVSATQAGSHRRTCFLAKPEGSDSNRSVLF